MRRGPVFLRHLIAAGLVLGLSLSGAHVCWSTDTGGQPGEYLRQGVGARALAMGNAGTAATDDASAAYWNPSLLPGRSGVAVASQTSVMGWDQSKNYLAAVYGGQTRDGRDYALALAWLNFSAGSDLEARTENRPEPDSLLSDAQNAVGLSLATSVGSGWSFGATGKLLLHHLGEAAANGLGIDLAVCQQIWPHWRWGVVVQDLYSSLTWSKPYTERVPLQVRGGVAGWLWEDRLSLVADLSADYAPGHGAWTRGAVHVGAEYRPTPILALRAGLDDGRPTVGAGVRFALGPKTEALVDYAASGARLPGAGWLHVFSLGLRAIPPEAEEQ